MSATRQNDIHRRFRDVASINLLFAALGENYPLFQKDGCEKAVDNSGKNRREKVFLTLKSFSTNFPQKAVDDKMPIL